MIRPIFTLLFILIGFSLAQAQTDVIAQRRAIMKGVGQANADVGKIAKGEARHGQAMLGRGACLGFVPGLAGGEDAQFVQHEFIERSLRQRHMGTMGWIECPAKHAKPRNR